MRNCRSQVFAKALLCLATLWAAGLSAKPDTTATQSEATSFHALQAELAATDSLTDAEEADVRARAMGLLRGCKTSAFEGACRDAILRAKDIARELRSRGELLTSISGFGYGLDLTHGSDSARAERTLTLGLIEHARGDIASARMWLDSTVAFRDRGLRHRAIASAAKLKAYLSWDEERFTQAAEEFALARQLARRHGATNLEVLEVRSAWAATATLASGHARDALALSTSAYEALHADTARLLAWPFAFTVFANHATVLAGAGQHLAAIAVLQDALRMCTGKGSRANEAFIRYRLGAVYRSEGRLEEAVRELETAREGFKRTDERRHLARVHALLERTYAQMPNRMADALYHARMARDIRYELLRNSRLLSLQTLQRDYRAAEALRRAERAEESAARADLERLRAQSQRTAVLLGACCILGLLAFVGRRLHTRAGQRRQLERLVAERTAQLQDKTSELVAKTQRLEASNEELERFAYIASHDLKTPLRNVRSFLGLIERRMPPEAQPIVGEYVRLACDYAEDMHHLVTDVLEFSRIDADLDQISQVFDVRALCAGVVRLRASAIADAGAEVSLLGAARLNAPPAFLAQVIGNLLDNAISYNESPTPRITIELIEGERDVRILVRDNGIGIAPEYHERVFALFKRLHTRDAYAGRGLGLSTGRKIARRLGGDIAVASAEGEGSTFEVRLPKSSGQAVQDTGKGQRTDNRQPVAEVA